MQIAMRILNLALGVVVTALVVRALGRYGYGQWSTIRTVLTLTAFAMSFGSETVAIREAAGDPQREHEWVGALLTLRLLALLPAMLLSLAIVLVLHSSSQMLLAGVVLTLAMPFTVLGGVGLIFQLHVDNRMPMLVLTLKSVLWGIAVVVVFSTGGDMVALAVGMTATNAIGVALEAAIATRKLGGWPGLSTARLRALTVASLPIAVSGVLVIGYARIDQVMVFEMVGSGAAGLYGSVYNVLEQAHFVPISILTTVAPVIAAAWPQDTRRLLRAVRLASELIAVASFGALAFTIVAAKDLVRLVFGTSFVGAAPALPILAGAFVFICYGYLTDNVLLVIGMQRRMLWITLGALIVNVVGNLLLIPPLGFVGAAWMTLITEVLVSLVSFAVIRRRLELSIPKPGRIGRAAAAAALLYGALALTAGQGGSLPLLVAVAVFGYPALLFGLRAVGVDDVRVLLRRDAPI
ncbi:MAG: flippase [Solirubrobacteraceae bacterium]